MISKEASIGVVMLKTSFPRIDGDIGNPNTFGCKVFYEVVEHATVSSVVSDSLIEEGLLRKIIEAAQRLEAKGVDVVATSCGFLGQAQKVIQSSISKPFIASSLNMLPFIDAVFGVGEKIGVITFDKDKLSSLHFNGAYREGIFVQGLDKNGELYLTIAQDRMEFEKEVAEREVVDAAKRIMLNQPDVVCFVLECTNLSPYIAGIKKAIGKPVFDIVQGINWLISSSR